MMKKKLISFLVAGSMVLSLIGCGGVSDTGKTKDSSANSAKSSTEKYGGAESTETDLPPDGEQVELELYTWWSTGEQDAGNAVIAEFEQENPNIKVNVNYIPYADYSSKLNTMISADETPDVFFVQEYLVNEWGNKGVGMDLAPLYAEENIVPEDLYIPTAMFKTEDHLWGISPNMTTVVMYYNKELFDEAGIAYPPSDPQNPWSWDQYVDAAEKLTKDAKGKHPGEEGFDYNNIQTFGTMMTSVTSWITLSGLLYSNGTGFFNEDGTGLGITSKEGIEVLQSVADLSLKNQVAPTMGMSKGLQSPSAMLMNGQLAMFMEGAYIYPEFEKEKYDVGVTTQPSFSTPSGMAWASAFMMSKNTKHPKEAFKLYKALADYDYAVDATQKHGASVSNLPNTKSSYESQEAIDKWSKNYGEDFAEVTSGLLTKVAKNGENTIMKNFSTVVEQTIMPQLDKLWLGEMSAEEAVQGLDEKLADKLEGKW